MSLEIDNQLTPWLKRLVKKAEDPSPLMRAISGIYHDYTEEQFDTEGQGKWPSLHEVTIANRKNKGHWPGKILQASGSLSRKVTPYHKKTEAGVQVKDIRAAVLQFGAIIKPKNKKALAFPSGEVRKDKKGKERPVMILIKSVRIPARPYLPTKITKPMETDIKKAANRLFKID